MKSLVVLFFGVLAIFCLQSTATEMQVKSIPNKEEYLKGINDRRRKYAKEANISNMNKLIWDDFLERKAQMNDENGNRVSVRACFMDGDADALKQAEENVNFYFNVKNNNDLLKKMKDWHMNGIEDVIPGQKTIGCAPYKMTSKIEQTNRVLTFQTLCYMAPDGLGVSWNVTRGHPGSACGEGYENDDGLCVPKADASGSAADSKAVPTPASRPDISTAPVDSSSHGSRLFDVFLAMIVIYGMF